MANKKPEGTQRVKALYSLDKDNRDYVEEKGKLFARGKRGGNSEALNRMIEMVRDMEGAEE